MFEKIHSYHLKKSLIDRMKETGDFLLPISIYERRWLKSALEKESAPLFLKEETRRKLARILADVENEYDMKILEKGKLKPQIEMTDIAVVHNVIRQALSKRQKLILSYVLNDGERQKAIEGFPYKLEFYVQKQQWYVLWVKKNHTEDYLISTPLSNIYEWQILDCSDEEYAEFQSAILHLVETDKQKACILVKDTEQRQSIFYCLSCFDKEIIYDEETERYSIILYYRKTELYDLLQKLRFLGKRVLVTGPQELRSMMKKSAERAVKRYQA